MNEIEATNIREIKISLPRKLNVKNNKYDKVDMYRNKCIKFNHKRVPQLK